MNIIKADQITVGCQLAEKDGFLWDVTEIVKETAKTITVKIHSDFSNYKEHWNSGAGLEKTFNKKSRMYAILA